jgi:FKBP-type peptidyl-prolyl cis-trans isomerase
MAYGEAGRPPVIPAKADLIFELEVLFIRPS